MDEVIKVVVSKGFVVAVLSLFVGVAGVYFPMADKTQTLILENERLANELTKVGNVSLEEVSINTINIVRVLEALPRKLAEEGLLSELPEKEYVSALRNIEAIYSGAAQSQIKRGLNVIKIPLEIGDGAELYKGGSLVQDLPNGDTANLSIVHAYDTYASVVVNGVRDTKARIGEKLAVKDYANCHFIIASTDRKAQSIKARFQCSTEGSLQ